MDTWIRPALILGAVAVLITLNVLEFRAKRRADRAALDRWPQTDSPQAWLARRRHETLQNIEQVLHIVSTVLIAILIAVLTA
ncbi:hypothetical protein [Rhodobaculum claviforme]|uniref:Uncharacterized protein n=1 Tax=Rhodobaculum claviforme TaxID=1549854 RepID=A0A934TKZ7_9RHOB|nr:hypothetical protein [Rhodobaculum claviforme]MBK5927742.1 hypothetical protein [Rhodobaculum claviforme]